MIRNAGVQVEVVIQEFSKDYIQLVTYIDFCIEVLSLVMWSLVIERVCQPR